MGQIKDIIDKGYREIADRLISRKKHKEHFDDSTAPNSDNLTHHVSGFDDCNDIFYRLLEDVGKRAELGITHESLFKFFGGHAFIDFGSIDTDGDILVSLLEVADYKRIASILYYAKHHKKYDEELERAYSEAIGELFEGISEPETFFAFITRQGVDSFTRETIENASEQVYNEIYMNPNLCPKYKKDKETFMKNISEFPWETAYSDTTKTHKTDYKHRIEIKIRNTQYLSIDECCRSSPVMESMRSIFFRKTIVALAGFNYDELISVELVDRRFILVTMQKDINKIMRVWFRKFGRQASCLIDRNNNNGIKKGVLYEKISKEDLEKYSQGYLGMKMMFATRLLFLQILIAKNPTKTINELVKFSV